MRNTRTPGRGLTGKDVAIAPQPPAGNRVIRTGTNHAERVFRVQQAFTRLGGASHSLAELARESRLDDSTVHRILQSGVEHGTIVRVGRGRYRLGPPAARLAAQSLFHVPGSDCTTVPLRRLRQAATPGLAFFYGLTFFGGARRECIDMAVGDSDLTELGISPRQVVAANRCLRLSTPGRVMLAHLPRVHREQILSGPPPVGGGPGVYRDADRLRASLAHIREHGFAIGREECTRGWNTFATPVSWGDVVVGAVALLIPAHAPHAPEERLVAAVRRAGAEIGTRMGQWQGSPTVVRHETSGAAAAESARKITQLTKR
ncbi:IclR family transcriptional regulator [Streptomyces sp. AJS327]|uniref:IclR family transcriptional regulator n=1 Tax=Streptomyces sp. AJS327 TaxID=2545265 RepID=UPI0015E057E1|nr:IclR family transcriptional regulator C-terminal domain-containing protein [Streptomyces sp. AJS327]